MNNLRKQGLFALFTMTLLLVFAGCARHSKSEHYYLVAANTGVPYWKTAADGFGKAATEDGVTAEMRGPKGFDPQAEVEEFKSVVALKPAGILVSVANSQLMMPEINAAIDAGIPVAFGSDGPTNPYLNIMFASLHSNHTSEAITREQAVVAYTLTSAYAEFAEKDKGSITVGKLADMAVL